MAYRVCFKGNICSVFFKKLFTIFTPTNWIVIIILTM